MIHYFAGLALIKIASDAFVGHQQEKQRRLIRYRNQRVSQINNDIMKIVRETNKKQLEHHKNKLLKMLQYSTRYTNELLHLVVKNIKILDNLISIKESLLDGDGVRTQDDIEATIEVQYTTIKRLLQTAVDWHKFSCAGTKELSRALADDSSSPKVLSDLSNWFDSLESYENNKELKVYRLK